MVLLLLLLLLLLQQCVLPLLQEGNQLLLVARRRATRKTRHEVVGHVSGPGGRLRSAVPMSTAPVPVLPPVDDAPIARIGALEAAYSRGLGRGLRALPRAPSITLRGRPTLAPRPALGHLLA